MSDTFDPYDYWPLIVSAWAGDEKAQKILEPLPIWLTISPPIDQLTGRPKELWQEFSAEIGYVCSVWSAIEVNMEILFATVTRSSFAQAKVVFGTITSNKVKRDLILNCARLTLVSDAHLKSIERILRRIGKAASYRNFLVHGSAGINTKYPERICIYVTSADLEPALTHYNAISLDYLQKFRKQLNTIALDLAKIAKVINRAKHKPLLETRGKEPNEPWEMPNSRQRARSSEPPAQPASSPPSPPPEAPARGKPPYQKHSAKQRREMAMAKRQPPDPQ